MTKTMWIRWYNAPKVKSIEGFSPGEEMAQRDTSNKTRSHQGWKVCSAEHGGVHTEVEIYKGVLGDLEGERV